VTSAAIVPTDVLLASNKIAEVLNKRSLFLRNNKSSLFALDFIISNNGNIYLLEGNTGPGLDWNLSSKENKEEAQKFIRIVVKELAKLARQTKTSKKEFENVVVGTSATYSPVPDIFILRVTP